jgi:hypothetical protein
VLNALGEVGCNPRRSGAGYSARCPAHEDKTPSLSLNEGEDGKVLIKCQAGCRTEEVVRALGLSLADLFMPKEKKARSEIVATYDYTDESGQILFQVVRTYPRKDFFQRRPNGSGGWIRGLGTTRRVLYRLHEVVGAVADGATVFVTEGEKDADAIVRAGEVATCNPMGAGKWRHEYADSLAGAVEVIVVADADGPGRDHARAVVDTLIGRVGRVLMAEAIFGKDAADHLAAGHSLDELACIFDSAKVVTTAEVEGAFMRWLVMKDPVPLRAALAAVAAHRLGGDPCDLMIVGGSGSMKTVIVDSLARVRGVVVASHINGEAALLSGTSAKERAADATGGLLRQIGSDGILSLKDFTTVLSMHRDARAQLLAALREVHDGYWSRVVGTDGGKRLEWKGRCSLVAACTTALDTAHAVLAAMGNRFFIVRTGHEKPYRMARRSMRNAAQEEKMRAELQTVVAALFEAPFVEVPQPTGKEVVLLARMAQFVSQARSPVERDHRGEVIYIGATDAPTRAARTFAQLRGGMLALGYSEAEAREVIVRVALDSMPGLRRRVLTCVVTSERPLSTPEVVTQVRHPKRTVLRALEDLQGHGLLRREWKGAGHAATWELSKLGRRDAKAFGKDAFSTLSDIAGTPPEEPDGKRASFVAPRGEGSIEEGPGALFEDDEPW